MDRTTLEKDSSQDARVTQPPSWKPQKRDRLAILSLMVISLMVALDTTVLVPVLPAIADSLKMSALETFWAGTSYLLTCAVFQPFIASLSGIFGRQEILLVSLTLFTIGTIIICTAGTGTQLLAGRSVQGIGGGGIIALVSVIFTDIIPLRERPKYIGMIQMMWALGTITGPLIGGAIATGTTWRWVFYINFPFCALGYVMVPAFVKLTAQRMSVKAQVLSIDFLGNFLFIGSTSTFLIGLSWGGVQFPWASAQTLAPLLIGALGTFLTIWWEKYGALNPFLRISLFDSLSSVAIYLCAVIQGLMIFCQLYYLTFWLESVKTYSPILSGVSQLAVSLGYMPTSIITGIMITRLNRYRWAIWAGWGLVLLGTGLTVLFSPQIATGGWVMIFIIMGVGQGMLLTSLIFSAQAATSLEDNAHAAALFSFFRSFGQSIGVAFGGTIFQNQLFQFLYANGLPTSISRDAEGYLPTLLTSTDISFKSQVLQGYSGAFRTLFIVLTGVAALGGLLSLCIKGRELDRGSLDRDRHGIGSKIDTGV